MYLVLVRQTLHLRSRWNVGRLVSWHRSVGHCRQLRLQFLAVLLHVYVLNRCVAVVEISGAVGECVEAGLLWRRLRWGREKIRDLLDAFGEI